MKTLTFLIFSILAILGLYQISLKLIFDIPSFTKGENSEMILYDSIGIWLYANAQATSHLSFGYSHLKGTRISVRSQRLAYCLDVDREQLEKLVVTEGVKWKTYFARNGSHIVFLKDTEEEIRRVMYNSCLLYLFGFLPLILLYLSLVLKKLFLKMKTRYW